MVDKLISNLKLDLICSSEVPKLHNHKSEDLILLFEDGFISRGYYTEEGWFGYNTEMKVEHYISNPKYYIIL